MSQSQELLKLFRETDYIVDDDPPLVLKVGERHEAIRPLFASFGVETGAFITAWNPHGQSIPESENFDRQADLLGEIEALRLNYFVGEGVHPNGGWREHSYLVLGIEQADADRLGEQFDQVAYLWIPNSGVPELRFLDEAQGDKAH